MVKFHPKPQIPLNVPTLPLSPKITNDPFSKNPPSHTKQSGQFPLIKPVKGRTCVGWGVMFRDKGGVGTGEESRDHSERL
jgi:hypothetical protein